MKLILHVGVFSLVSSGGTIFVFCVDDGVDVDVAQARARGAAVLKPEVTSQALQHGGRRRRRRRRRGGGPFVCGV